MTQMQQHSGLPAWLAGRSAPMRALERASGKRPRQVETHEPASIALTMELGLAVEEEAGGASEVGGFDAHDLVFAGDDRPAVRRGRRGNRKAS